ncbi:hypothetical protein [Mariprofundus sp. KV]|uniref:hypothetical protein n=1 Tax=Mariprofundus sp. KV TaxID=2608715 RepID=UPI0015A25324|nr:hypothetical protein [Mariprofundus sp. KV]NWF36286.1 hypothetical protein [Mariprofundus sp. KV]
MHRLITSLTILFTLTLAAPLSASAGPSDLVPPPTKRVIATESDKAKLLAAREAAILKERKKVFREDYKLAKENLSRYPDYWLSFDDIDYDRKIGSFISTWLYPAMDLSYYCKGQASIPKEAWVKPEGFRQIFYDTCMKFPEYAKSLKGADIATIELRLAEVANDYYVAVQNKVDTDRQYKIGDLKGVSDPLEVVFYGEGWGKSVPQKLTTRMYLESDPLLAGTQKGWIIGVTSVKSADTSDDRIWVACDDEHQVECTYFTVGRHRGEVKSDDRIWVAFNDGERQNHEHDWVNSRDMYLFGTPRLITALAQYISMTRNPSLYPSPWED